MLRLDDDRQEPVLEGVAPEDVGEARRDHRPDAPGDECPGRVLARRAGPEVVADEQDLPVGHRQPVHHGQGLLEAAVGVVAPVVEERVAEPVLVRDLEIAGRDDLVGVDVLARQRDDRTRERGERDGHLSVRRGRRRRRCPAASADR